MITFGSFDKSLGNPLDNEELLIKIVDDIKDSKFIHYKVQFKFEDNDVYFTKEVNPDKEDLDINYPIE